ncbi:MAG TPA: cytochrome C oxidase subunit III, partial [Bacteroidales bacterium]|nr:cytochrome C oxidase subunit III [Bacteroidales bacterium]
MEHTHVQHTEHRDDHADKMGMWLFLFTELLLFGGLFLVYSIYRYMNQEAFMA